MPRFVILGTGFWIDVAYGYSSWQWVDSAKMPTRSTRQSGVGGVGERERQDGTLGTTRTLQAEYLSLAEIVRTGVDTARRARAEGVRARLEDLIASGHGTDDGSVRVLRAALKKADQQRAAMLAEERRVPRARHRMRRIEDKRLVLHASEHTRNVHRECTGIAQQRVQSYCALRSQLRVKRSLTTLRRVVENLNALLQALAHEHDRTQRRGETPTPIGAPLEDEMDEHGDGDGVQDMEMQYGGLCDSSEDLDIRDGIMSLDGAPSSTGTAATTASDSTQLSIGSRVRKILSRIRSVDTQTPGTGAAGGAGAGADEGIHRGQRGGSEYGGTEQSHSRLLRVRFARKRFVSGGGGGGEAQGASEYTGDLEESRILDGFTRTVKASKGLARYTVTRIRNPAKARKLWAEAEARYALVLSEAPHFTEESLVPLGTIEGGLLGERVGLSSGAPGGGRRRHVERIGYMCDKVNEALILVGEMEAWQTRLVERIRTDYRAFRARLRELEGALTHLYIEQITGSTGIGVAGAGGGATTSRVSRTSRNSRTSRSSSRVRGRPSAQAHAHVPLAAPAPPLGLVNQQLR